MEVPTFYGCRKTTNVTTMQEALNMAETSNNIVNLVVLPPTAGDSVDQESDVENFVDDPEEQHEPAGHIEVEEMESDDDETVQPRSKKQRRELPKWKKNSIFDTMLSSADIILPENLLQLDDASPYEIWRKVFSDEMVSYITKQTNLYANRDQNNPSFEVSEKEIRNFLGILLLSGYHTLPEMSHYWSTQPDLGVPLVSNTMSKNRFFEIKKYLHFADNQNLEQGNKMSKISPIYVMLNDRLVQFGVFHELLSVDESMVPYYGRHSAKMFICRKPIRFGYKVWCLCGNDGFPYHLKLYQGKEEGRNQPLGMSVISKMVDVISSNSSTEKHQLYFDNFFTSYDLLVQLAEGNVKATGTIRENRSAGAGKALIATKALQKMERGSFDHRCDGKVYVAKWNDNAVVGIASNWQTQNPVHTVKRRVKGGTKEVSQPHLIHSYNKGMGGVDLMDRLSASYRPMIRGKKWYWPLFLNALNVSIIAAWRLHCKIEKNSMSHLNFRRQVTLCLMNSEGIVNQVPRPRHPTGANAIPADVRYDGINHTLASTSQGRCRICQKNTKNMCKKCNVRLHAERGKKCFENFHKA